MRPYLVLDGPDGCGKSTQAILLCDWLRASGRTVVRVREPGSTAVAEALRRLLLDPATGPITPLTEALLFSAARRELLEQHVRPALDRGAVVVAERCFLSTLVYQGHAPLREEDRVPLPLLLQITEAVHAGLWPATVCVLDLDAAVGKARRDGSEQDRIERQGDAFFARVHDGYRRLGRSTEVAELLHPGRVHVLDAAQAVEAVQASLRHAATRALEDAKQ